MGLPLRHMRKFYTATHLPPATGCSAQRHLFMLHLALQFPAATFLPADHLACRATICLKREKSRNPENPIGLRMFKDIMTLCLQKAFSKFAFLLSDAFQLVWQRQWAKASHPIPSVPFDSSGISRIGSPLSY
jgi:hypothetical protein